MFRRLLFCFSASFIQVVASYKIRLANNTVFHFDKHNRCMSDNCVYVEQTGLGEFAQRALKLIWGYIPHVLTLQSLSW